MWGLFWSGMSCLCWEEPRSLIRAPSQQRRPRKGKLVFYERAISVQLLCGAQAEECPADGKGRRTAPAGVGDAADLLHLRLHRHRLRAGHHHLPDHLRPPRHPGDRLGKLPLRRGVGLHGGGAQVRHPAHDPHLRLRYCRGHCHRCAHRLPHGRVSLQGGPPEGGQCGPPCGGPVGRHPLHRLRPGGPDGAGPLYPGDLQHRRRREPAGRHRGAGCHDSALHHLRVRDRPQRGAPGV